MQSPNAPALHQDLVLIGGGHAHALVLRSLGMRPIPGVRVTVINPGPTAPYSGMLPGFVAGHYTREALEIDLVRLADFANARLVMDRAVWFDRVARRVTLAGQPSIAYDRASLDIGITSDLPSLPGFTAHALPAKPLGAFAEGWAQFAQAPTGPVAVLGGGVAGVELAMACAHRLRGAVAVHLLDRGRVVEELPPATRRTLLAGLKAQNVVLHEGVSVTEITAEAVLFDGQPPLQAALVIGAAGARPQPWLGQTGLTLHEGFVTVDASLRSSDPAIYAVGDTAHMAFDPRPKAGVYAVRQAPVLLDNLRADMGHEGLIRSYKPQRDYLKLISLGEKRALANRAGMRVAGAWMWRWKDRIDQKFMSQFRDLPVMGTAGADAQGTQEEHPLCAGCGSKVGALALEAGICALPDALSNGGRADVLTRAGDDAAVLRGPNGAVQVISVDHLRAFEQDPWLMSRLALIHALGDVWAMGAQPQVALSSVILPRMSDRMQAETLREITEGALSVLSPLGAELVGGHTTMGAEFTLGFTVTGTAQTVLDPAHVIPGDLLVLSKPIGTGTLLAARMRGLAKGDQIAALLRGMSADPSPVAATLAPLAHGMTDVTGFGLAGHARRLVAPSGHGAELWRGEVPFYDGAVDLATRGVRSTLYPSNRAFVPNITDDDPRAALLFDPQTCGGFLAAIPAKALGPVQAAHPDCVVIGQVTDAPGVTLGDRPEATTL